MTFSFEASSKQLSPYAADNLVDLLKARAVEQASKLAYVFLEDGEREGDRLSYADLDRRARAIAARLTSLGLRGERVLLLYPQGLPYIEAFFGCLYAGVVAVPAYPPSGRHIQRLQSIFRDATPSMILTTAALRDRFETEAQSQLSAIACGWTATDEIAVEEAESWDGYTPDPNQIAFLQYTSGSTGDPRGVMITHANLLSNEELIKKSFAHDDLCDLVGWLPLYHDMGLIGNVLQPLYVGATAYLMSPMAFLEKPVRWLKAISKYRAHTSGGPNFAYDLCVRKVKEEGKKELDLSCWRIAFSGAEPVRASTLDRFSAAFADVGFSRTSFFPCYGLAEATLVVTAPRRGELAPVLKVDRQALESLNVAPSDSLKSVDIVGCGHVWSGTHVEVVHPEIFVRCSENKIGEIWVKGPGVAKGYWQRPEETERTFGATIHGDDGRQYLRTGDLGFFSGGDCFISGRLKDLIIVAGRNFYPQDIESVIEERTPGVRPGCSVAFSFTQDDQEALAVILEPDRSVAGALEKGGAQDFFARIRSCVVEAVDIEPSVIALILTGSLPKTSSGKVRRSECRRRFLAGELKLLARSDRLAPAAGAGVEPPAWSPEAFIAKALPHLPRDQQVEALTRLLIANAAALLKMPESMIVPSATLPEAGLSSIRSIELKHRLDATLRIESPIGLLLSDSPISSVASALADCLSSVATETEASPSPFSQKASLSRAQSAMWTIHHLDPESNAYNLHLALELKGELSSAQIISGLRDVVQRHAQLRSVYAPAPLGAVQKALPSGASNAWLTQENADDASDADLQRAMAAQARKPFDLERSPPLRVTVYNRRGRPTMALFVAHHIAIDLWSLLLLLKQLDVALRSDAGSALTTAEDYSDFVAREQEFLSSRAAQADWAFWSKRLEGPLPVLALPERKVTQGAPDYSGGSVPLRLDSAATQRLETLARKNGASLHTLLASIYFVLLHRLTGQTDLIVGTPTSGRLDRRSARLIGNCVNPVPIRLALDRSDRFTDVLRRARMEMREVLEHQLMPFPVIVERLQPERDGGHLPIYQTWFVLQEANADLPADYAALALGEAGASISLGAGEARTVKLLDRVELFDLKVMGARLGDELLLSFQYRTQVFDAAIVERFARYFKALTDEICRDPDGAIARYRLLDDAERQQILVDWNATADDFPRNLALHQLFEAQAARAPHALALAFEGETLTYGELNAKANQLAHGLRRLGVGAEATIGLCLHRSVEMVVGIIGVLKAGAAYLPLDPDNPDERLAFIIDDAAPALVLTSTALKLRLPGAVRALALDGDWASFASEGGYNLEAIARPLNLAYVIYTSGSTGKPKGVGMAHEAIVNRLDWMQKRYGLCETDAILQKTPFGFDVSVWEFFWALSTGARLILLSPDAHRDPYQILQAINRYGVTTLHFVPSMLQAFLSAVDLRDAPSLQRVFCSGEELSATLVKSFQTASNCELHNLYGPTEAAIDVSAYQCAPCEGHRIPIGRPVSNVSLYVLDSNFEPTAIGVAGDLYIGGVCLARGYLRRPDLTADRFVPSPFDEPGGRLYRTGDVARYRADGEIEYLGRSDQQVKVRGFRIELGEIEAAISALENVAQTVAVVPPAHDGGSVIVAYVTGAGVDVDQIRMGLQRCLPEYMIPHFIVALDEMPLSRNGKIDRSALPAHSAVASSAGEYVAPAGREEEAVVEAFADALGLERVGAHDGFFRLGGDSIRAIQVAARLRQAGYEVTPRQLFERQTAVALAPALRRLGDADAQVENDRRALQALAPNFALAELNPEEIAGLRLEFGDVEDAYPLTPMQEGMYFHALSHSGTGLYHMQERYKIKGALDIPKFAEAWQCVVDRHPNLRTSFRAAANGRVHQIVLGRARLDVTVDAIDHLSADEQDAYVDDQLKAERAEGFDLSQAPLMRIRIIRLSADRHICVRSFHHIIMDDWCTSPLLLDMRQHYAAALRGEAPHAAPAGRFHDYIAWLRIRDVAAAEKFWRSYLQGFSEPTPLVGATTLSQDAAENVADAIVRVSPESYENLKTLAQQSQLTVNTFVQGALALLLSVLSGREEVVFGVTVSGRPIDLPGVESTLGLFINGLPLRVKLRRDTKVVDWLRDILSDNLEMRQHEFLSQPAIQRCSAISRADGLLFQHLLTFENAPIDPSLRGEKDVLDIDLLQLRVHTNYPLTFVAIPDSDLTLRLTYDRERFDPAFIETVAERFKRAVEELAAKFDGPLGEVSLLSREEHSTLLEISAGRDFDYGSPLDLVDCFEAQALCEPETVAARCDGASLNYGELNKRANELAHVLIREGVGPDVIVALLDARGLDFLMMLLAIFKAGGAYLPLDPAHPDGRIGQVLEESRATFLLVGRDMLARGQTIVSGLSDAAQQQQPQLLALEALQNKRGATSNPPRCHSPDNLAFIIYTSGSTGKPKGAMVEHRGMFNNLITKVPVLGLTTKDVIAQTASQCFDISVWQFLTALAIGARVEIFPDAISRDPRRLGAEIAARGVTILEAVPSMIRALLDLTFDDETPLAGLRWLLPCGEAFAPELCRRFMARYPQVRLLNAYGPAECSDDVSYFPIETPPAGDDLSVPIGRPVDNTQIYLLDRWLEPAPAGVASEICIGGVQVGRGYLHRPDLTAAAFTPNPFGPPGSRLYRSGDLGRWRDDGVIDFLGRVDHQVKIRGHRIEPNEVAASLLTHPGVGTATVIARATTPGVYQLVAYVVAQADAIEVDELRRHLQQTLPDYMIPSAFVFLDALPLTPNGKIDRKALPEPDLDALAARAYVAPRTPTEAALCRIWADVLRLERVGVYDNFFELGGHSLLAMTLIEKMRREGLRSDVRSLFVQPTPAGLAVVVGRESAIVVPPNLIPAGCDAITPEMLTLADLTQAEIDRIVAAVPGGATNVQDIYPLTPLQGGILFHHLMATKGDPYLYPTILAFDSRERLDAFCNALRALIARHDILRTAVMWDGLREPMQVVWREASLAVEEVSLDRAAGDAAQQLLERFSPRQFRADVRQAPMIRVFWAKDAANDRVVLQLLVHHLVLDHAAQEFLLGEIAAYVVGRADELAPPIPFRNFVAQARLGVSQAEHEAFFDAMLGDVTEPTTPFGLLDVRGDGSGVAEAELDLDPRLSRRLRGAARLLGVSVASLWHLAFAQVLARVSGRNDVVFGTVLFGRMHGGAGADRAIGMFLNTLPIRVRVGQESVEESARGMHDRLTALLRHEHASLALAQRCSGIEAPAPLFSALLNYRHSAHEGASVLASQGLEGATELYWDERTNYPFDVSVDDFGDGFGLNVQTRCSVDPNAVCSYIQAALTGLVTALETSPETPALTIDVLSEAERHKLLVEWNDTAADYPKDGCIHELFEAQAAKTPEAVAVVFEEQSLTYGELNARANQLAHHLRRLGVGPETLVGVSMTPSADFVIAILGILKADGGYVPIDPSYPLERTRYILKDANLKLILASEEVAGSLAHLPDPNVAIGIDSLQLESLPRSAPPRRANGQNTAYVIYTSGSTGRAKGVPISHSNLVASTSSRAHYYGASVQNFLLMSSFAFDSSVAGLFGTLCQGGALHITSEERRRDPRALAQLVAERQITHLLCLPSLFSAFLESLGPHSGSSLQVCIVAGEECKSDLVFRHFSELAHVRLYNEYGPTECSVWSTVHQCESREEKAVPVPIGRPISNTQIYLLDGSLELVPVGVSGELYIGGAGLARGYLDRPDLTAERFVPNPFGSPGQRLYRTGDLARYRQDGNIEYLGRTDHQVKIRGFRIELGEIEAALGRLEAVREAVALAREDSPGDKRIVAYIVGRGGAEPNIEQLRGSLMSDLPDYMIPSAFMFLEALPLTPNGKVDRKALPAPDFDAQGTRAYVAPRTTTEWLLLKEFKNVLGLESIGVDDNFFELGGHSLTAIKLIDGIRRKISGDLPTMAIFQAPTARKLAEMISGHQNDNRSLVVPLCKGGENPPIYCIHPAGGSPIRYQAFADSLQGLAPVNGIQSRRIFDDRHIDESLEKMAECYVRQIRDHQPQGPYFLLGWSSAGVTAVAIAEKLEALGKKVAFVGVIDSFLDFPSFGDGVDIANGPTAVLDGFREFAILEGKNPDELLTDEDRKHLLAMSDRLSAKEQVRYIAVWGQERGYWQGVSSELIDFIYTDTVNAIRMICEHDLKKIQAPIHYWAAQQSLKADVATKSEWSQITQSGLKFQIVAGDHTSIVSDPILHAQIRDALTAIWRGHAADVSSAKHEAMLE
ncbi:amino acid adenylation domain-containing protein [Methylocystis iwaonis]|uniref:amino acid adenylation domain-containing protein n=1 Tax=Methylocystis iwaonis TaxID=2885079 RepID=UPI002E7C3D5D|nr:amino acid adenylation domain-containing protein [Methylocystis iwaonis]